MFATHFQNIEMAKCSATHALRMAGAGKLWIPSFVENKFIKFLKLNVRRIKQPAYLKIN